jgi:hypothetical protein
LKGEDNLTEYRFNKKSIAHLAGWIGDRGDQSQYAARPGTRISESQACRWTVDVDVKSLVWSPANRQFLRRERLFKVAHLQVTDRPLWARADVRCRASGISARNRLLCRWWPPLGRTWPNVPLVNPF